MNVSEAMAWYHEALAQKAIKALTNSGFEAFYVPTGKEAAEKAMEYIEPGMSVAFGGSVTLAEIGLADLVKAKGADFISERPFSTPEEKFLKMRAEQHSDVYVSSANALSADGSIFNIDAVGNRVAATIFGPRHVIIIAGINKLVPTKEDAVPFMEAKVCPINSKKLDKDNPCTKLGYCVNCNSPSRLCRTYTEIRKKPFMTRFTVIIAGEQLGV